MGPGRGGGPGWGRAPGPGAVREVAAAFPCGQAGGLEGREEAVEPGTLPWEWGS